MCAFCFPVCTSCSSVGIMILAYVQTPFVCNQVRILSNALLDTAAGNWSFSYMWTDVSGIGRLYPNIKEITSKNSCPSQYWSCFCSQKKKFKVTLYYYSDKALCNAKHCSNTHRFCESTDHNTIHLGHQSFFPKTPNEVVFYLLPDCFYSKQAETGWEFSWGHENWVNAILSPISLLLI